MGSEAWTAEAVEAFTRDVVQLLRSKKAIARALNEPVRGLIWEEVLRELGYEEDPPARVRREMRRIAAKQNVFLIGDGRGWFIGTSEHAANHNAARTKEAMTRTRNLGVQLAATPRETFREQQSFLDSTDKGTVMRRFVKVLEAAGAEDSAGAIQAALPAPR